MLGPRVGTTLEDELNALRLGDVVAFGGDTVVAKTVKEATNSPVSHVGIVVPMFPSTSLVTRGRSVPGEMLILESVGIGTVLRRLTRRVNTFHGRVWILPLSEESRKRMNAADLFSFLMSQEGKPYDVGGAVWSQVLRWFGKRPEEDLARIFCSELIAGAYVVSGVLPVVNVSAARPIDLCRMDVWGPRYFQVKGASQDIPGYNGTEAAKWRSSR